MIVSGIGAGGVYGPASANALKGFPDNAACRRHYGCWFGAARR